MHQYTSKPEISRISPCNPGEMLQIFGENLCEARVYVWLPTEAAEPTFSVCPLPERPACAQEIPVVSSTDQVLYATMPYGRPGCMLVWVVNEAGEAAAVVNRPEIWNQSLRAAVAGDRLALFGRNFFGFDQDHFEDTRCVLKEKESGKLYEAAWGPCQDLQQYMPGQNDHKSECLLPSDLPAGEYLLTMTNGTGGAWGWAEPVELTVNKENRLTDFCRKRWSYDCRQLPQFDMNKVCRVSIPFELGDGMTDATDQLQRAVDAVSEAGGGIVQLPAGRFGISRTLQMKAGVVLRGAGMGATTLTVVDGGILEPTGLPPVQFAQRPNGARNWAVDWKPYLERENNTPLIWIQTDAGIENMKIEGGSGAVVLVLVGTVDGSISKGVFFNNVHVDNAVNGALFPGHDFSMTYHGILTVGFTEDFTVYKCHVTASHPLFMLPAKNVRVRLIGNEFEVSPHQVGDNVYLGGSYNGMIAENVFRYGRRTLMCQQGFFNNWVFQNRSEGVANTTNANEEYMSEYGYNAWAGTASEIGGASVTVDFPIEQTQLSHGGGIVGDNLGDHRWILIVLHGRGLGQYRHVTGVRGNTIYLDRPWDVMPNTETFFNLVTATEHNLWVNNYAGLGSGNSQFVYLAGVENIVAAHSMLLASGMTMYAMEMERDETGRISDLGVVAYNSFSCCDARYSGMGLCLWTNQSWSKLIDRPIEHMNIIGNLVRWNSFIGGADSDYVKNQSVWNPVELPSGLQLVGHYNLVEKNLITGYDAGVHIRASSKGNMVFDNQFKHNGCDVLDDSCNTTVLSLPQGEAVNVRLGYTRG